MNLSQREVSVPDDQEKLRKKAALADALIEINELITQQTGISTIIALSLSKILSLTDAGAAALWTADQQSYEFILAQIQANDADSERQLHNLDLLATFPLESKTSRTTNQKCIVQDFPGYVALFRVLSTSDVLKDVLVVIFPSTEEGLTAHEKSAISTIGDVLSIAINNADAVIPSQAVSPPANYQRTINKLERRHQALTEYVGAIAHDLKAPLSSIRGYVGLIQSMEQLDPQASSFLQGILDTNDRMFKMVQQLLDIALITKDQAGRFRPVDLQQLIDEEIESVYGAAASRHIEIATKIEGDQFQFVGDETRLERCLLNLLDNALKHSPDESRILVTLRYNEATVDLVVADEGPGIDEADLPHIFEKFYQGRHHDQAGIGLGLQLVKTTAEVHHGKVSVRNRDTGGAEFMLTLPANQPDA